MIIFWIIVLIFTFYLLARVCDEYFVPALDKISDKWKLPSDVTGATLMAIGSSAPELFVAIIALVKPGGHEAIGAGTIVGSALFNVLVIIGVSAIVAKKAKLAWQPVMRDLFFYSVSIIFLLFSFRDGNVSIVEAGAFVLMYVGYVLFLFFWKRICDVDDGVIEKEDGLVDVIDKKVGKLQKKKFKSVTVFFDKFLSLFFPSEKHYGSVFVISILIIAALSWVLVESAVALATILNISSAIIALTVLAIGTSVPDMISSIIVAKQGRGGMAISNAVGSNIFDILFGLGLPWFVLLAIKGGSVPVSVENLYSSIILLFATVAVVFFLLLMRHWKLGAKAGWALVVCYVIYLVYAVSQVV